MGDLGMKGLAGSVLVAVADTFKVGKRAAPTCLATDSACCKRCQAARTCRLSRKASATSVSSCASPKSCHQRSGRLAPDCSMLVNAAGNATGGAGFLVTLCGEHPLASRLANTAMTSIDLMV